VDDRYGKLILTSLRGQPVHVPGVVQPDRIVRKVSEHGLASLLADVQRRSGRSILPRLAARVGALASAHEAAVRHNLEAAREIAGAFERSRVPVVFVKGAALAVSVYERPGLRPFGDLDLLVRPDSVPAAAVALAGARFRPEVDGLPSSMETAFVRLDDGGLPVGVDLHWDFTEPDRLQAAVRIPVGEILERRRIVQSLPIPTPEDSLLLAAANLIRSRVDRMILVVDFARLAASGPDWDAVVSRAEAWRLRTALWLGLALAERHFDAGVPDRVRRALAPAPWRRRWIGSLLSGSALWARRKIRHRCVAYGLPLLCADSLGDVATALGAGRGRLFTRLGLPFAGGR